MRGVTAQGRICSRRNQLDVPVSPGDDDVVVAKAPWVAPWRAKPARAVFGLRLVGKPGTAGIHDLRALLKRLLRQHGFVCVDARELTDFPNEDERNKVSSMTVASISSRPAVVRRCLITSMTRGSTPSTPPARAPTIRIGCPSRARS